MHNIKIIREDSALFKKKLAERNVNIDLENLLTLDKRNRETIQKKEKYIRSARFKRRETWYGNWE